MTCEKCGNPEQNQFKAEIAIHFPERPNDPWKAPVLVFPKLLICSQCGRADFTVPETELGLLAKGNVTAGRSQQTRDKAAQG